MARSVSNEIAASDEQMVQSFAVNERMNQLILQHLEPDAWRAKTPGRNARTIAAIFAHMHNVRRKWLRLSTPHIQVPSELDRSLCTQKQVRSALAESARLCCEMLGDALADPQKHQFLRDGWSRAWRPGPAMFAYMLSHEAHHRGQICMLAHQLGFPLPVKASAGIWMWEKLWKECGFKLPAAKSGLRAHTDNRQDMTGDTE